jgi:hypothetical protein
MARTLNDIITTAQKLGYTIDKRPFKLNIIGVRNSAATNQIKFDDQIAFFHYDQNGNLVGNVAPATTDPSTYFLNNPINSRGAGILKSGEYKDAYQLGLHRNSYKALVQAKPVTVIRDNDRNSFINYFAPTQTGLFGINIHRASLTKNNVTDIETDSAGCQVFQNASDFNSMMQMADTSNQKYGNKFSYILIDERDTLKLVNTSLIGIGLLSIAFALYLYNKK